MATMADGSAHSICKQSVIEETANRVAPGLVARPGRRKEPKRCGRRRRDLPPNPPVVRCLLAPLFSLLPCRKNARWEKRSGNYNNATPFDKAFGGGAENFSKQIVMPPEDREENQKIGRPDSVVGWNGEFDTQIDVKMFTTCAAKAYFRSSVDAVLWMTRCRRTGF